VDAFGRPTTASGLLAMPINGRRRLTAVSFTHGTEGYRGDAPSMQPSGFDPAPAYAYASAGFATAEPDYLGLGTGPGPHPWMDVPSETTAALDMLRAARGYAGQDGRTLERKVMVTGFSQGASAALGLGRALQDGADGWFRLGALAPISGAYDFQHAELPAILDGELVRLNPNPRAGRQVRRPLRRVHDRRVRPGASLLRLTGGGVRARLRRHDPAVVRRRPHR
jgi:predicted dienelactone hydrolase